MTNPVVFFPAEVLTFDTVSSDLKRLSATLNTHSEVPFLFDLGKVSECDSAGLAFLIEAKRLCALKKNDFRIKNISKAMVDLATFCGIKHLLLEELADG
ncbi:MAG: STAS domain-containing protein [Gammaproteobacteria bacterium]|nr:STAS domain-containing protein [Gammaproteobacteria bacterium]